jgi:hypothetical protein
MNSFGSAAYGSLESHILLDLLHNINNTLQPQNIKASRVTFQNSNLDDDDDDEVDKDDDKMILLDPNTYNPTSISLPHQSFSNSITHSLVSNSSR